MCNLRYNHRLHVIIMPSWLTSLRPLLLVITLFVQSIWILFHGHLCHFYDIIVMRGKKNRLNCDWYFIWCSWYKNLQWCVTLINRLDCLTNLPLYTYAHNAWYLTPFQKTKLYHINIWFQLDHLPQLWCNWSRVNLPFKNDCIGLILNEKKINTFLL